LPSFVVASAHPSAGTVWKTHAFATPSRTARRNAKKRRELADDVRLTLVEAAKQEAALVSKQ
jgi:hypothetical protein